jgi:hypothetical protein
MVTGASTARPVLVDARQIHRSSAPARVPLPCSESRTSCWCQQDGPRRLLPGVYEHPPEFTQFATKCHPLTSRSS